MRGWGCRSLYYSIAVESGEKKRFFQEADVVSDNRPANWDITCLKLSNKCPKGITSPRSPYFFTERIIILEMHRDKMFVRLNPNKSHSKRPAIGTIFNFYAIYYENIIFSCKLRIMKFVIKHNSSSYCYGDEDKRESHLPNIFVNCKNI